jgi:hypothetical protein
MSEGPAVVVTGGWYALAAILEDQQLEFDTWGAIVAAEGGLSCPVCGEPLQTAPPGGAGSGVTTYCRYAGDHKYRVPGDVVRPARGARMGRYG